MSNKTKKMINIHKRLLSNVFSKQYVEYKMFIIIMLVIVTWGYFDTRILLLANTIAFCSLSFIMITLKRKDQTKEDVSTKELLIATKQNIEAIKNKADKIQTLTNNIKTNNKEEQSKKQVDSKDDIVGFANSDQAIQLRQMLMTPTDK